MELRIFGVVVSCCDEPGQPNEGDAKQAGEQTRPAVGECGKAHETSCVYHGELIDKLHGVLQSGVEQGRPSPDYHVAYEGDDEDGGMSIPETIPNSLEAEPDEEDIRQGL